MKVGTKVTYTAKGFARDYIFTMTSLSEINNLKKDVYTKRNGIITDVKGLKSGDITFDVKWEDVGGYFQDDSSYALGLEDIQEAEEEEEAEEAEEAEEDTSKVSITIPCKRCGGAGGFKHFAHIYGGVCFRCDGLGVEIQKSA